MPVLLGALLCMANASTVGALLCMANASTVGGAALYG